jgi:hypothetical protein
MFSHLSAEKSDKCPPREYFRGADDQPRVIDRQLKNALGASGEVILEGETPRLLDEWPLVPDIWNHVRHIVDTRQVKG